MAKRFTTETVKYGHYGYAAYRIEVDLSDSHRPMQRHIWTRDDGSIDVEDWIPTIRETEQSLLQRGWTPVDTVAAA